MGKTITIILAIALVISLAALVYGYTTYLPKALYNEGYNAFSAGYVMGADNGSRTTVSYIIDEASQCKEVPVSLGTKQAVLVSTACLQKA